MSTAAKNLRHALLHGVKTAANGGMDAVFWPKSRAQLRDLLARHPTSSPEDILAVSTGYKGYGYYKKLYSFQVKSEFQQMIQWANEVKPRVAMEIGTAQGGTLLAWCRIATEMVISVDLPRDIHGLGYWPAKKKLYTELAYDRPGVKVLLFQSDSHSEHTKELVKSQMQGKSVDILFIDGDHSLAGVTRDFELWKDLVRPGGYVAFHDIVVHDKSTGSEVDQLWEQIKKTGKTWEFVENKNQGWGGIGVWQKP